MLKPELDLIHNEDFVYLTGSLVFDRDESLKFSDVSKSFLSLYNSNSEFRNIILYLQHNFSDHLDLERFINFSETIHPSLNQFFYAYLTKTKEYTFYKPDIKVLLILGFNYSKVIKRDTNTILCENKFSWDDSIDFFLKYV